MGSAYMKTFFVLRFFFISCGITKYSELKGSEFFVKFEWNLEWVPIHAQVVNQVKKYNFNLKLQNKIAEDVRQQLKRVLKKLEKLATIESQLSEISAKHVEER